HVNGIYITSSNPFNGVPGNAAFQLFSDMMLHDMGAAADGIGQNDGDDGFRTRLIRTPVLRGLRVEESFMHDGRATTIEGAINAHGGTPASQAAANFRALSATNRTRIFAFLNSL
ncbi:MAG TPA: di-heme oxidoredictase family protein, partial [Candidatus Acidoferrum sp.]|nr:di-heme oxidoredictase family protein [Candidatus Acidoferrum sp.]